MNEEGESPSGSQAANKDKKKDSFSTKVIHKVGLEKRSVVEVLENEVKELKNNEVDLISRITQLLHEIDSRSKRIEHLEKDQAEMKTNSNNLNEKLESSRAEIDRYKNESEAKVTEMHKELKLKSDEIVNLKGELETKSSLMSVMEKEIKLKSDEIDNLKANEAEWKSLISKMEKEMKLKSDQFDNLKITQVETKVEWSNRMTEKENEMKSKDEEIENLKSRISQLEGEAHSAIDDLKKTEIMIRAKFTDVSKLTEKWIYSQSTEDLYSEPTEHAGVTWKMGVHKDSHNGIVFFLHGKKENDVGWFCLVIAEFLMFSQKSKEIVHRKETKLIYDAEDSSYCMEFISHKDLFNEEKGFVKDDSVIVAVAFRSFPRSIYQTLEMTIDTKFIEISKLTKEKVYSQPTEFAGVTWKMNVRNLYDDSGIGFFLDGKKENAVGWWCPVIAEFQLISQKSKEIVLRHEKKLIYDADNSSHWLMMFDHKGLFNDEKGFVKDDSIIVAVSLRVVPIDI